MNSEYVQNLRYKLQKRVRKLNSTGYEVFHYALRRFWKFLHSQPVFVGILEDLERRCPEAAQTADQIVNSHEGLVCDDELENAAVALAVIRLCVESDQDAVEIHIGQVYGRMDRHNDSVDGFRDMFLETLYEYLDEHLDDQRAMLALLRRYKHKCEWFQRETLYRLWRENTQKGEKRLALHLYEYLHDQGIDFSIEASSISGEADLIAAQRSDDPLIADAKIFDPEKGKGKHYLASGFHQVYRYTLDYNEPFGYLVVFKTCAQDVRWALSSQEQSTPFVVINNKTIFILTIDIHPYEVPASKRGPLKVAEITEQDLIREVESTEGVEEAVRGFPA
jgi:hypothetical protein